MRTRHYAEECAADTFQRPLRSHCQARLTPGVIMASVGRGSSPAGGQMGHLSGKDKTYEHAETYAEAGVVSNDA